MAGVPPTGYLWSQFAYNGLLMVGIPGNLIIMKVYSVKSPRCSAHIFIMGLAIADLFCSLLRPLSMVLNTPRYGHLPHSSEYLCRLPRLITIISMYSSVFLTTAVAFDRYYCVCRPHERKMTPFRAKVLVTLSIVLSILVSLPNLFAFGLVELPYGLGTICSRVGESWLVIFQKSLMYISFIISSLLVVILYRKVFQAIKIQRLRLRTFDHSIQTALPTEVVAEMKEGTTVTSLSQVQPISDAPPRPPREAFVHSNTEGDPLPSRPIGSSIGEHLQVPNGLNNQTVDEQIQRARKEKAAAAYSIQRRTTKMLLLTTAVFLITWIPALLLNLIPPSRLAQTNRQNPAVVYAMRSLTNIVLINHAINPVIYGFVNKRFRNDCVKVLRNIKWPWRRFVHHN